VGEGAFLGRPASGCPLPVGTKIRTGTAMGTGRDGFALSVYVHAGAYVFSRIVDLPS
jgi:hypothetical protein